MEEFDNQFWGMLFRQGARDTENWQVDGNVEGKDLRFCWPFRGFAQSIDYCNEGIESGDPGSTILNAVEAL